MVRRTSLVVATVVVAVALVAAGPAQAQPRWVSHIGRIVASHPMSVVVGDDGAVWYRHRAGVGRPPASNEKLLLSMALLNTFGPDHTFALRALAPALDVTGTADGNLYIKGQGDPEVGAARLNLLASRLWDAGLRHLTGHVVGVTGPFHRDWFAPGWKSYFPAEDIALPTALTFAGNVAPSGRHVHYPEALAATNLTHALRHLGVTIGSKGTAGPGVTGMMLLASASSKPLRSIMERMDHRSINFSAEVLGKALAYAGGEAGTIANGAAAICAYEAAHGVHATCHDGSGLSYGNRQTAIGILHMLWNADHQPWLGALRMALPAAGQGTLRHRLGGIRIRAKTGTLDNVSALSGWIWNGPTDGWITFSMLTSGMEEYAAKDLEDRIAQVLANRAKPQG
jgi:D-alanyl-D-alanine carboxypeptidase/D-alanyl-D-alanine-endopeptidase (penicillin-binding protein 4)